jgi:hypothetical protein
MRLAHAAVGRLPDLFREHLHDVVIRVEEFVDAKCLNSAAEPQGHAPAANPPMSLIDTTAKARPTTHR